MEHKKVPIWLLRPKDWSTIDKGHDVGGYYDPETAESFRVQLDNPDDWMVQEIELPRLKGGVLAWPKELKEKMYDVQPYLDGTA